MWVKRLPLKMQFSHRIRIGDGLVLLVSDPGELFKQGDQIHVRLSHMETNTIRVAIEAPRESVPISYDQGEEISGS